MREKKEEWRKTDDNDKWEEIEDWRKRRWINDHLLGYLLELITIENDALLKNNFVEWVKIKQQKCRVEYINV